MLNGFATYRDESLYPELWEGLRAAWCPMVTDSTGSRLFDVGPLEMYDGQLFGGAWVYHYLNFNGIGSYVQGPNAPFRNPNFPQLTFGCWFKTANPGTGYRGLICKQGEWGVFLFDGLLRCYDWASTSPQPSTVIRCDDGKWHLVMVACTLNAATLYFDGIAVASSGYRVGSGVFNGIPMCIGSGGSAVANTEPNSSNTHQNFIGQIADCFIYGSTLPAASVRVLFDIGQGGIFTYDSGLSIRGVTLSSPTVNRKNNLILGTAL